eukprot:361474-Chlamydomonas_euryale.AAC.4
MSNEQREDVHHTFILPIFLYGCEMWTWTKVQMGTLGATHSNCLHRTRRRMRHHLSPQHRPGGAAARRGDVGALAARRRGVEGGRSGERAAAGARDERDGADGL